MKTEDIRQKVSELLKRHNMGGMAEDIEQQKPTALERTLRYVADDVAKGNVDWEPILDLLCRLRLAMRPESPAKKAKAARAKSLLDAQHDRLRRYALLFGLEFCDKAQLVADWGEEEWEGVHCAAFERAPMQGPMVALITDKGVARVVAFWAGDRWDADKLMDVDSTELDRAVRQRLRLHAK